jgi:hypothetical protein
MSLSLYRKVARNAKVGGQTYHTLCHLALLANGRGEVRCSQDVLLHQIRAGRGQFSAAVQKLERAGHLRKMHAGTKRRVFVVVESSLRARGEKQERMPAFFLSAQQKGAALGSAELGIGLNTRVGTEVMGKNRRKAK